MQRMQNYGAVEGRQNSALSACCLDFQRQSVQSTSLAKATPWRNEAHVNFVSIRSEWWINGLELLWQMWISFEMTNPRKAHDVFDSYSTHDQAILYPRSVTVSDTISVLKDKDSGSASFGTRMRFTSKKFKVLTQH